MTKKINYGDFPKECYNYDTAKIVILPVPYDKTSTWIKGADKGPTAIIDASPNMEFYDIETNTEVFWKGIYTDLPVTENSTPEKMVHAVKDRVKSHLKKNKFLVLLGGEHSISIGAIEAHAEKFKNMCVLQLDAHSDLRDEYHGSKNNHACVMARAKELCPIVQVGIRSIDTSELNNINKKRVFFAENIYNNKDWIKKAVSLLSPKVYLTIDLDVFDPSIMPSTGTPEPGGLGWYDTIEFIKEVIKQKELVGLDIVELCPNKENKAPDFLASKLIYKILTYKYFYKK